MKTILLVLVFAFAVSFSGTASNVATSVANKTEMGVSKTNHSSSTKKTTTKKPHAKKHHKATTAKKAPVVK